MKTECLQMKLEAAFLFLGGKGKDRVVIIKSLIYARVGRGTWKELEGVHYKRSTKVDQMCKLIKRTLTFL